MLSNDLIKQLQKRDLISQITDEEALSKRLREGPISLYCGFDPTSDSLHLGHLVPLLCLKRFQLAGHRPIVLIGGATGLIGDPSFRMTNREFNTTETVQEWTETIKHQVSAFLDFNCGDNSAVAINNHDWFSTMNVLTFLRNIGKCFSIKKMINKEIIKQRLDREDSSISFTEFAYNLLQGYDFSYLNEKHGVTLQIGGSDQWSNITAGIDLTRRLNQNVVFGLTVPLFTKTDGTKFGKTGNNVVWLDSKKTSPYKFYQFLINTSDNEVYRFLKLLTFLDLATITALEEEDRTSSKKKLLRAQSLLAEEVTRMVHGEHGLAIAKYVTTSLFNDSRADLTEKDLAQLAQTGGMPVVVLEKGADLQQALVTAKLVRSRRQARVMIASNAIAINGKKQVLMKYIFSDADRLYDRYTLLCRGKKNYCLLCWK